MVISSKKNENIESKSTSKKQADEPKNADTHPKVTKQETTKTVDTHPKVTKQETAKTVDIHPKVTKQEPVKKIESYKPREYNKTETISRSEFFKIKNAEREKEIKKLNDNQIYFLLFLRMCGGYMLQSHAFDCLKMTNSFKHSRNCARFINELIELHYLKQRKVEKRVCYVLTARGVRATNTTDVLLRDARACSCFSKERSAANFTRSISIPSTKSFLKSVLKVELLYTNFISTYKPDMTMCGLYEICTEDTFMFTLDYRKYFNLKLDDSELYNLNFLKGMVSRGVDIGYIEDNTMHVFVYNKKLFGSQLGEGASSYKFNNSLLHYRNNKNQDVVFHYFYINEALLNNAARVRKKFSSNHAFAAANGAGGNELVYEYVDLSHRVDDMIYKI